MCRCNIFGPPAEYKLIQSDYSGTIIEDLSNNFHCDFAGFLVDYEICIHSVDSNDCFSNPCGDGKIYTSFCKNDSSSKVGLEVNGVKNGTVLSIYCLRRDCSGEPSKVMLFNVAIRKFTLQCNL